MCKITIITVVFNCGDKLRPTFDSVANQIFKDYELLVIDGKSTDNTIEVVETYESKVTKLRVYSEMDKGIYDAMNKGIGLAKGDYFFFLNAGDILYDTEVLSVVASAMDDKRILYGNAITKNDKTGEEIPYRIGIFTKYRLAHTNICHQTIFYPKEVFCDRRYNLKYRLFADWALNLELWKTSVFKYIDKNVVLYENGGVSAVQKDQAFSDEQKKMILKYLGLDAIVYLGLRKIFRWK